jgi:putative beta barrel porin BBP7
MKPTHILSVGVLLAASAAAVAQVPQGPAAPPPCPTCAPGWEFCPTCCPPPEPSCGYSDTCWWFSPEYLFWHNRTPRNVPPLVTTSLSGLGDGIAGDPDTKDLLGRNGLDPGWRSGMRFSAGVANTYSGWFAEGSVFGFDDSTDRHHFSSDEFLVLARPFFDANNGVSSAFLVAFPDAFAGTIDIRNYQRFRGGDFNVGCRLCGEEGCSVDVLVGARYMELHEKLNIDDSTTQLANGLGFFLGEPLNEGDIRLRSDVFETRNKFYGPQIGLRGEVTSGPFFARLKGLVAFGKNTNGISVHGDSTLIQNGLVVETVPGGLLALPSNIGRIREDNFIVVPQLEITVGVDFDGRVRIFAGYSYLYWHDVVRPYDNVPAQIDTTQVPTSPDFAAGGGSGAPAPTNHSGGFWMHGLNAGLAIRF